MKLTKKLEAENKKLLDVVKRRTEELENKNRELEIETALEKVRAVAMGMKKPEDMLVICKTISKQLASLGIKEIRNVQTAIFYPERGSYMNYEFYAKHNKTFITDTLYTDHKIAKAFAARMMKGKGEFYITHIKGKKVKDWIAYQKTTNVFIDSYLYKATSLNYYWFSLGPVALGISTYQPLTEEEKNTFKRFLNVFELSYRRYLDIEKAQKQARGAQIEVAVERVRARALAMRRSEEILGVVTVLWNELKGLNIPGVIASAIYLKNDDGKIRLWDLTSTGELRSGFQQETDIIFSLDEIDPDLWITKIWKSKEKYSVVEESNFAKVYKWVKRFIGKEAAQTGRKTFRENHIRKMWMPAVQIEQGRLTCDFIQPPPAEMESIMLKIGAAFDFAYKRFLDLQKAEAQAKEARIELGLERVRARAMAMQNSGELAELVSVVFKELTHLDFALTSCIIWISDKETLVNTLWVTSAEMNKPAEPVRLKPFQHSFFHSIIHAWKEKDPKWIYTLTGKEKKSFEKSFFANEPKMPVALKKALSVPKQVVFSASFNNFGALEILGTEPLTEEKFEILHRFGKVFNSSYTRFNDLKKAEALAREAQIEAALERVRARAMAMHKSSELKNVARELRSQLGLLGTKELETCAINLYGESSEFIHALAATRLPNSQDEITESDFLFPKKGITIIEEMLQAYSSGVDECVILNEGVKSAQWMNVLAKALPDVFEIVAESTGFNKNAEIRVWWTCAFFRDGSLIMITMSPPDDESRSLLKRFALVFGMAYRRFADLKKAEAQTREAQIEAALEKVRAKVMAMNSSADLNSTSLVFGEQLRKLGIDWQFSYFWLIEEDKEDNTFWITWPDNQTSTTTYSLAEASESFRECIVAWRKQEKIHGTHVSPENAQAWLDTFERITNDAGGVAVEIMKADNFKDGVYYYDAMIKFGSFGILMNRATNDEEKNIQSRFATEFERAYTRFLDLQKAEAQAREAEIQLALERVRARSLAMHHTSELQDVVNIVAQQLHNMGMEINGGVVITINSEVDENIPLWASSGAADYVQKVVVPFLNKPIFTDLRDAIKRKNNFFTAVYTKNEKTEFFKHLFRYAPWNSNPEERKKELLSRKGGLSRSACISELTSIVVTNHYGKNFSDDENDILKRFGNVFEQSYTRFLDLQKAEAQAREAQIQLSLERVRAKAMAMYHTDELNDVLTVLFEQFDALGLNPVFAHLSLFDLEKNLTTLRITGKGGKRSMAQKTVAIDAMDEWKEELANWKASKPSSISCIYYPKEVIPQIWELFGDLFDQLPLDGKISPDDFSDGLYCIQGNTGYGYIGLNHTREATEEEKDIIQRFAIEFGRVYQRFLDLQKAEAQAREANIEAGLERVRSRAMAMQSSEELNALIGTVFTELTKLDLVLTRCIIWVFEPTTNAARWWMANGEEPSNPMNFLIKYHEHPAYLTFLQQWKKQNVKFIYDLKGQNKISWDHILFNETELKNLPDVVKNGMRSPERVLLSASFNNFGGINVASLEPLSDEHFDILLRFAKVFDLTYTRFNDLKQAEAQARESQIQLALERVRARTMAMQKSDELPETAAVLFQQFKNLGEDLMQMTIGIVNEAERVIEFSVTDWGGSGSQINQSFKLSIDEPALISKMYETWKKQKRSLVVDLTGKKLEDWINYRNKMSGITVRSQDTSGRRVVNIASFSKGLISYSTPQPRPDESIQLLERFAGVFDLTYTRFLDLQKAEAQAREARIEASLERVRSKTMAMHNSNDVGETVTAMFAEFTHLDIHPNRCGILIFNDENSAEVWTARSNTEGKSTLIIGKLDLKIHKMLSSVYKAWKSKESFYQYDLMGEDLMRYYEAINKSEYYPVKFNIQALPANEFHSDFFFPDGAVFAFTSEPVAEEHTKIFKRFASVFGQTYGRYLDLLKAEAQAREAQIEAALERVRSRTMAMQHSNELKDAALLLFHQVQTFGVDQWACGYNIWEPDGKTCTAWMARQGELQPPFKTHPSVDSCFQRFYDAKKRGESFYVEEIGGEEIKLHYKRLISLPEFKSAPQEFFDEFIAPEFQIFHIAYFEQGYLMFITYKPVPEIWDIFKRFAKVFEQTYTRFLDLQKAEAQARESQIQLALERVRARTMAMQHSNELPETSQILFNQMKELGEPVEQLTIGIVHEENNVIEISATLHGDILKKIFWHSIDEPYIMNKVYKAWKTHQKTLVVELRGDELNAYNKYRNELTNSEMFPTNLGDEHRRVVYAAFFSKGMLALGANEVRPPESLQLLERFASVFDLTYTRFLDLQKAEAQAREAQIEAALERVRSRSMGMQKSEELKEVIKIVYQQLIHLKINLEHAGFVVDYKPKGDWTFWIADERDIPSKITHPYFESVWANQFNEAKEKGEDLFVTHLNFEEKNQFYHKLLSYVPGLPEASKDFYLSCPGLAATTVLFNDVGFYIENFSGVPYTEEENNILMRFGKVFQQTYTRFLDLQKAETQARESQIQLALERVRARTMAMQRSDELPETSFLLFQQLKELGETTVQNSIAIINEEKGFVELSTTVQGHHLPHTLNVPIDDPYVMAKAFVAWKEKRKSLKLVFEGQELKDYNEHRNSFFETKVNFPEDQWIVNIIFFSKGWLSFSSNKNISGETFDLLKRFAAVFEQTYIRFNDLKQAEIQARESQIQLALERVRARTMAMQKSEELGETSYVLFQQFNELGDAGDQISIGIFEDDEKAMKLYSTFHGNQWNKPARIEFNRHPVYQRIFTAWKNRQKSYVSDITGEELQKLNEFKLNNPDYLVPMGDLAKDRWVVNTAFFSNGLLSYASHEPRSKESIQLLERFASVFDLTYTRFLDLQKAENSAKEATIEAALEKVRGKAMAMHNSSDLTATASTVFTELRKLGINPIRCGVGLLTRESRKALLYSATSSAAGDSLSLVGWVMLTEHPVLENIYDYWLKSEEYYPQLSGEQLKTYYEQLLSGLSVPKLPDWKSGKIEYGNFFPFSIGCLYAWSATKYNDDEIKVLKRFATIIDLTFRRYLELQKSEANAKEAVKQAALDRIRADIASMRRVSDLNRITPLIWNELTILGLPFIRCGIFLMDDTQRLIHTFLSTPEGKAIAAFHLPYDTPGNFAAVVDNWRKKNIYIDHWTKPDFVSMADTLVKQKAIQTREQYLDTLPADGFYLHFIPFLQGMLYVGNIDKLGATEISLIESVADAFSTAYARYEDFNKLEAAKKQVDNTLNELQAAQKQLIQSEKMASLGELTAGIAHEIQNPLNFVNNFSEVSNELIQEMLEELGKGNFDIAKEIAEDVKQNLDKINHHGKRADGIVKGMLQHSRTSSGQKELTDINALADEYLRLAYHGLRAKDKSFNAKFETDFDTSIEKINLIPQEIGRVILNLINNAFYTVNEKQKNNRNGYEPLIIVKTSKENDKILISVKDNGNGIPDAVKEKIFQPFFTTKPTGQGTGLGLSLSYDIVKAHGGELKVNTKEGEGTDFIIQLNK